MANWENGQTSFRANGNRTSGGSTTGDPNRLSFDGTYTYVYDAEGNRTARFVDEDTSGTLTTGDTEVTQYTWDYRNRLVSVTDRATYGGNATQAVDYVYDVNNQLVGKILDPDGAGELGTSEEYYAYDRGQILFRFDGPSRSDMTDRYLWGPAVDLLLCDEKVTGPSTAGDIYWTLGDNVNTIRDITRYDPATDKTLIVNHRAYDAFGNLTSETNPAVDLLFSYTGRQFDESTNLQYNWRRWYDAVVGRWMSEDPIGFTARDTNLYRYVRNAPLNRTDPLGEQGGFPPVTVNGRPICPGENWNWGVGALLDRWPKYACSPSTMAPGWVDPRRGICRPPSSEPGLVAKIIAEANRRRGTKSPGDDSAHHCWAVCQAGRYSLLIGGVPTAIIGCIVEALERSSDWAEDMAQNWKGAYCAFRLNITCDSCCGTYRR